MEIKQLRAWFHLTRGLPVGDELRDIGREIRHPDVLRVRRELVRIGIRRQFRFIWSRDESGVEEEKPLEIHIQRSLGRAGEAPAAIHVACERLMSLDLAAVARHELGHALLFLRPRVAKGQTFRRLFGDVDIRYRVGNPIDEVMRRITRHRGLANRRYASEVSLYAATHPHERFAETVRIALKLGADESALHAWAHELRPIVTERLCWVASWLRNYKEEEP